MKSFLITLWLSVAGMLLQGLAAEPTPAERKKFVETKAKADQGNAPAQTYLGFMYESGSGVVKDEVEAVKWYRKAADQGYALAQFNLGLMYANGRGVPKDEAEAYKWWLLAGAQGHEDAKQMISFIEGNITPAQRTEGQRRAREWKPRKP